MIGEDNSRMNHIHKRDCLNKDKKGRLDQVMFNSRKKALALGRRANAEPLDDQILRLNNTFACACLAAAGLEDRRR
jgi:hypothetical protein